MKKMPINFNIKWYEIFGALIITLIFFSLPLLFTADSAVYLNNAEFFDGTSNSYSAIRGPVVPFVLFVFGKIFSYTIYGLTLGLFLIYITFVACVMAILCLLDIPKLIGRGLTLLVAMAVLFLNVIVLTYSHAILTEFFIIVFSSIYILIMLLFYKYKPVDKQKILIKEILLFLISLSALLIAYAIKQMFFPVILLIYFSYKVVDLKGKVNIKNIFKEIILIFLLLISILFYVSAYSDITTGANLEGDSVSSYASSFLIDGLRYFVPQGDIVYGEEMTIVINDNKISAIDSFSYTFQPGIIDSVRYLANCFINSPSRFFESYKANYGIVSGVVHPGVSGVSRKYTYASQTLHFDYLYESGAWIEYFKTLSSDSYAYPQDIGTDLSNERFQNQSVDTGLVSNLLFNTYYANLSIIFHTTAAYYSFIIFLISIILLVLSKKFTLINKKWCILNIILSFNIFPYLLFLAVTAQNIDRYGIPTIVFTGLIWIINIAFALNAIIKKSKNLSVKPLNDIHS